MGSGPGRLQEVAKSGLTAKHAKEIAAEFSLILRHLNFFLGVLGALGGSTTRLCYSPTAGDNVCHFAKRLIG
jgi:hypothetical protein